MGRAVRMGADKEVHQTPFINERGSISSNDLRRRNSWWRGRSRSRPAGCRRRAGCCKPQIACPTGWFPSKISTVLAFNNNINTNSMSNRRFPPHTSQSCKPAGEGRGGMIPGRWSRGELEESRGCLTLFKSESFI